MNIKKSLKKSRIKSNRINNTCFVLFKETKHKHKLTKPPTGGILIIGKDCNMPLSGKEMLKRYGVVHPHQELHHIFGKIGILKLMPDNVIPINRFYHVMQKSSSVETREHFQYMVKNKVNSRLYDRLYDLADYIKNKNVLFGK